MLTKCAFKFPTPWNVARGVPGFVRKFAPPVGKAMYNVGVRPALAAGKLGLGVAQKGADLAVAHPIGAFNTIAGAGALGYGLKKSLSSDLQTDRLSYRYF